MSTRNRDVKLQISATDQVSGPLGRATASVDRLKDSLASFDGSSDKGVSRSFQKVAQTISSSGRMIDREVGVLEESLETRGKNLRAALRALGGERSDLAGLRKRATDIKGAVSGLDRTIKMNADAEARAIDDRARVITERRKAASDKIVRDARAMLAREQAAILAAGGKNSAQRAGGYANLEKKLADEGLTRGNQNALFRKAGKVQADSWKAELSGVDFDGAAFANERKARAASIDQLKNMRDVEEKRLRDTEKDYNQSLARVNKLRGRIRGSIDGIRQNRVMIQKAGVIREDFRTTAVRTEKVRATYDQNKDRAQAAAAVDGIAGANGNVARTAALGAENRRAAGGIDVATSALKRKNAALGSNAALLGSVKSQLAGLVSGYIIFSTVVGEASKAIDVFRSRQAFDAKIGATNNNNLQDTAAQLAVVRDLAQEYGLEITDLQQKYSSFAVSADAVGISTAQVQTVFDGLSAAARVNKLTQDQFSRAVTALTQSMSKNQVMAEELKGQLAEALPGAVGLFAQSMGYASTEMKQFFKDLEEGKFDGQDIVKFAAFLKTNFADSAKLAGDSFDAMLNRFYNSMSYAREAFANAGLIDGLMSFMVDAQAFLDSDDGKKFVVQIGQAAEGLLNILGMIVRNIDTIVMVMGSLVLAKFAKLGVSAFSSIFGAMKGGARVMASVAKHAGSLSKVMRILRVAFVGLSGPLGAAITGLAFLTPWIMKLFGIGSGSAEEKVETTKKLDGIASAIGKVRDAAINARGDVDAFNKALGDIKPAELTKARDENKVLIGQETAKLKAEVDSIIAPAEYDYVRGAGRAANVASPSLPSNKLLRGAFDGLVAGTLPYQDLEENKDSYLKVINDLRKAGILTDEELKALSDQGKLISQRLDDEKALTRALEARNGDAGAQQTILGEQSAALAEENAKKLQLVKDAISKVEDAAKDTTGLKAIEQMMKDNESSIKSMTEALDNNKDALSPEQYEAASRRIGAAMKKMGDDTARAFLEANAAANGFDLKLSEVASNRIQSLNQSNGTGTGPGGKDKASRAAYIRQGLISRGMPEHVADAFLVNFQDESALNPAALEGKPNIHGTRGYGLYQLTNNKSGKGRREQYETFAGAKGKEFGDIDTQLDFLVHELETTEAAARQKIMSTSTTAEAAQSIVSDFLRPAKQHERDRRARYSNLRDEPGGLSAWRYLGVNEADTKDANAGFSSAADRDRVIGAVQGADSIARSAGFSDPAIAQIQGAVVSDTSLASNPDFLLAIQEKRVEDVAKFLAGVDQKLADEFVRQSSGNVAEAEAKDIVDAAQKASDEAKKAAEDLADIQRQTLEATLTDEREKFISATRAELEKRASDTGTPFNQAIFDARLAEFDAGQSAQRAEVIRGSGSDSKARIAQARAENDLARERIRLNQAAEEAKLTGVQREQFVRNGMAAFQAEQQRNATDAQDSAVRSAQNEVALAQELTGLGKARLAVEQEIAEEERKSGVAMSAAAKAARITAAEDAYKAGNPGWASEDAMGAFNRGAGPLTARRDRLMGEMDVASSMGDTSKVEALRSEIAGINVELLKMIDNAIAAMEALKGPENEAALESMRAMRTEVSSARENVTRYGQAAQYWGQRAGDVLASGMDAFARAVAEGENPWKALGQTISAAIGQILIDIGLMIIKAAAAKAIMQAMGIDGAGMPTGGGLGASANPAAGILKSVLTFAFSAATGAPAPVFHDGGQAGDMSGRKMNIVADRSGLKGDEVLAVLQKGEEVVTADNPRHANNFAENFGRLQRYHTGGITGLAARAASAPDVSDSLFGKAMKSSPAAAGGQGGGDTVVNNLFDADDFISRAMSGPAGERMIANVISKNPRKFKALVNMK